MPKPLDTDIVITGAGPAGLFCALNCAGSGKKVIVLEKTDKAGQKLLMAGSGKCNITHSRPLENFLTAYGKHRRFVKPALYHFTNRSLITYLEDRQVPLMEMENGKIFPRSLKSSQILELLLKECQDKGVQIHYQEPLIDCRIEQNGFLLNTAGLSLQCTTLVLATGGLSYPATGSTGDGYRIAEDLGHTIVKPAPALTPVVIRDYPFEECAGNALRDVDIRLYREQKKIEQTKGDVLLTHTGLSGPGILDFSRYIQPGDQLKINMTSSKDRETINQHLIDQCRTNGKKYLKYLLSSFDLPQSVVVQILKSSSIGPDLTGALLTKNLRQNLVDHLYAFSFTVEALGGFQEAMVTSGGVALDTVSPHTMESKLTKGLYFIGEVLDVDGDTGGFNLQFAFSSAKLAADAITGKDQQL